MENRQVHQSSPIPVSKSNRADIQTVLTSGNAGLVIPLAYVPLLREDSVQSARIMVNSIMEETAELLMNGVSMTVKAYLVPYLAFDRFNGIDQLNRSFRKTPERDGGVTVPFIEPKVFGAHAANDIYRSMGLHARPDQLVNSAIVEAYNTIWNYRARNRSQHIPERALDDTTLAPAFWAHNQYKHIVPDFDQAVIDGEIPLTIAESAVGFGTQRAPVTGAYQATTPSDATSRSLQAIGQTDMRRSNGTNAGWELMSSPGTAGGLHADLQSIVGELAVNGVVVSLANIDVAKKTAAFARMKANYQGIEDDYLVDLLMSGVRIPEQDLRNPILLGSQTIQYGQAKRFSTSADDLTASVANGATAVSMSVRVPPLNTGGIILITAEVTPEQLFERQRDFFLATTDQELWPDYLRDFLDPEKVEVVPNEAIDVDHSAPLETFGYAPLNWQWSRQAPRVGGKYYRPEVDAPFDEDRQKIWAVETVDPTLTQDFYLCTNMHHKVFVDTGTDNFQFQLRGAYNIRGNTVFGAQLHEASDLYDEILAKVDLERIDKSANGLLADDAETTETEAEEVTE